MLSEYRDSESSGGRLHKGSPVSRPAVRGEHGLDR